LFTVVYTSRMAASSANKVLTDLLVGARIKNAHLGITGLLLHKNGKVMQALEGDERTVRGLISVISKDPRHTDFWVITEEHKDQRFFAGWSMQFIEPTDASLSLIPDYGPDYWAASRANELLNWFRDNPV
jgi:hypothetical protein